MMTENITFLGHATFKIKGSRIIYTDPYMIQSIEAADIILITHSHFDHCSVEDITKICSEKTGIIASKDCIDTLNEFPGKVIGLEPDEKTEIGGVPVEAVRAYNINKSFHPKSSNWNGYLFNLDGVRYYHPGDTDKIPEMDNIQTDIAFLPVGGTYTMDAKEACEVVKLINPKVAIPMHYGSIVGSEKDAETFVECAGGKGLIIPPEKNNR
ncbi:MAG: MBL fold metallo-hydrolase [Spirochaetota bacterium]|nr:MAG: MBL fold metallo-hydrolase [Spirochaetota bacterium]